LVVTTDGIPVGYEVFAGNRHDSTTVEEIVEAIEKKYGQANRIWVMDRGMVSEDNLAFVRSRDGRYIVGTPKASLKKFEAQLVEQDWEEVEAGVEVKLVPSPDGQETFILARSAERREKEKAIHQRFLQRMEMGLQKLHAAMDSGRLREEAIAHRRLGRLQGQNSRAAKAFDVTIERVDVEDKQNSAGDTNVENDDGSPPRERSDDQAEKKSKRSAKRQPRLKISWKRNDAWSEWARLSEGCYLLRSNLNDTDPKTLWKHYIQLTEAEWAFRITKDELILRPICHQKEDRVKAHILVCFLAYVMWKTLAGWMRRSGLGDAPRSLLNELAKIKSADVALPIHQANGRPPQTLHLRCVTEPDNEQKLFLQRLGLTLPRRLGSRLAAPQM
jgi:transposase